MEAQAYHTPVLVQEVLSLLLATKDGCYVDGTLGGGGHTAAMFGMLGERGTVLGIDLDDDALTVSQKRLNEFRERFVPVKGNFKDIKTLLSQHGMNTVRGILLDLGVSSFQLDEPAKGFSFRADERLDMRMDRTQHLDAAQIVADYDEKMLADVLWKYGEEKNSRRIARGILRERAIHPITSTGQLVSVVQRIVGDRFLTKTLARVFQAIRIEVNHELDNLRHALLDSIDVLAPGGRLVVISYHSLEDRIVKETFRAASARFEPSGNKIIPDRPRTPAVEIITKRPVLASEREQHDNPRARSAKLRAAQKV